MTRFKTLLPVLLSISIVLLSIDICYSENLFKTKTQYKTAILKYEKDMIDNPQDPKSYYNLAKLHYAIGDKKKAIEEFQKAKELYLAQGNTEAALQLEATLVVFVAKFKYYLKRRRSLSFAMLGAEKQRVK